MSWVPAATLRTTQLLASAIKRFPAASKARSSGVLNWARVAGPPSPEYQLGRGEGPEPAMVSRVWAPAERAVPSPRIAGKRNDLKEMRMETPGASKGPGF